MAAASSFIAVGPNTLPTDRERVIGELTRGREIADQLRLMLRDQTGASDATASVLPARGLAVQILDSFTRSISMLSAAGDSDEVSQAPAVVCLKSEDSGDSCKTPAPKGRRGCYKRRNYFRCTHKFDQGCQASKQVQRIQDDPPLYRTTYHGQHSCKNVFKSSSHQITIDAATQDSSIIWSFGSGQPQDYKPAAGNLVVDSSAIKQESKEGDKNIKSPIYSRDYFVSSEHTAFDDKTCSHLGGFSSGSADHGGDVMSSDVYSCTASTHSMKMDMDMMVGSVFDEFIEFESL